MIITCEKCSTRFNLDDSFIKESGSKVRCSVCKHISIAYPTPNDLELNSKTSEDLSLETDVSDEQSFEEAEDFQMEDNDFSLEESDLSDSDLSLDDPEDDKKLSIEDSDLEIEVPEFDPNDIESDDSDEDFLFEDNEFEMEAGDASDNQSSEFEFEEADSSGSLEMETIDPSDNQSNEFEFEEVDESDTFEMDEGELEIEDDGLEFELMEDEETPDLVIEDESHELELAEPDELVEPSEESYDNFIGELSDSSLSEEDEFELEFDVDDEPSIEPDDTAGRFDEPELAIEIEPDDAADRSDEPELEIEIEPDDTADRSDEPELEIEFESEDDGNTLSVEKTDDEAPLVITPEENFSEYDEVLKQETEPDAETLEEETIPIDDTEAEDSAPPVLGKREPLLEPRHRTHRRKKKPLAGAPVLILLSILLLIIGAYIASIMTGFKIPYLSDIKIPFIEQQLKKPALEINEAKPVPNQKSVNGRFVTNTTAGTLFVITGRVENPSSISYSHIKVLGTLITKGKTEAKTQSAYCGNIVSEEMLKTGNISDINNVLMTQTGNLNTNVDIKAGATIPFMVVFSELPEKLQNFTVKVTAFDKTTN